MKSRVISGLFDDLESSNARTFMGYVQTTIGLSEHDLAACYELLPKLTKVESANEQRRLVEEIAPDCDAELPSLLRAMRLLGFLLRAMTRRDIPSTDPPLWADDLVEAGAIDEAQKQKAQAIVDLLSSKILPMVEPTLRKNWAAGGVLPCFSGCGFTVEVRAVREDFYRRGTSIETFEPSVVDTTTIASVHLEVDTGTPTDLYFQVTAQDVDYLINMFKATKKEMAALENFLGVTPTEAE